MRNAILVIGLTIMSGAGWSAVINVPEDQPTIQAGIDATIPGDPVPAAEVTNATSVGAQWAGNSIMDFVAPDGRIDLDALKASSYQGPLDLKGFDVRLDPRSGAPRVRSLSTQFPADDPDDIYWDNSISPSVAGVGGRVYAATVYEGRLIIGGDFSQI